MKRIPQKIKTGKYEDSARACFASILEMELMCVPHYTNDDWFLKYRQWLAERCWLDIIMLSLHEEGVMKWLSGIVHIKVDEQGHCVVGNGLKILYNPGTIFYTPTYFIIFVTRRPDLWPRLMR